MGPAPPRRTPGPPAAPSPRPLLPPAPTPGTRTPVRFERMSDVYRTPPTEATRHGNTSNVCLKNPPPRATVSHRRRTDCAGPGETGPAARRRRGGHQGDVGRSPGFRRRGGHSPRPAARGGGGDRDERDHGGGPGLSRPHGRRRRADPAAAPGARG